MKKIFSNFWLKLFSLLLASIMWYYVNTQSRLLPAGLTEREFREVPVKILLSSRDTGEIKISPEKVNIKVKGKKAIISKLGKNDIILFVNLEGLKEGRYLLPLHWELPAEVKIISLSPREVKVEITFNSLRYK